ncbi:MAG TPA: hypothetical protein VG713_09545, partial [Pirellulales bacterium]|nr:hypothetical protein [Pirellulales bacterium]
MLGSHWIAAVGLVVAWAAHSSPAAARNLLTNGDLETPIAGGKAPQGYDLAGDVVYGPLGDDRERAGRGIRFLASLDKDKDKQHAGSFSTQVKLPEGASRWYRLRIVALAQDHFEVDR